MLLGSLLASQATLQQLMIYGSWGEVILLQFLNSTTHRGLGLHQELNPHLVSPSHNTSSLHKPYGGRLLQTLFSSALVTRVTRDPLGAVFHAPLAMV